MATKTVEPRLSVSSLLEVRRAELEAMRVELAELEPQIPIALESFNAAVQSLGMRNGPYHRDNNFERDMAVTDVRTDFIELTTRASYLRMASRIGGPLS